MSRLSWAPPALLARVLRDVRGRARRDLEPRGAAALAHAVAQLGEHTELVAEVVQELVPTLRRFARKGFKPAEVALSLDALSRMGGESHGSSTGSFPLPRWAEEAMAALEEDLARVAQHLRYPELVMVLVASARRSGGLSGGVGGVGEELMKAIEATFSNCPTAELCIMVHCMARLQLNFAMSQDLALVILDHLCPQKNPGLRTDCSLDHVILLLHAFAKLSVRPSQPYWALVSQRLRDAALVSRSNAVRLCLAAAKLDHRGVAIGHVYGVALDGLLANLCDEAFASMVFVLLHPFYFNQRHLQELLVYAAAREICAQSLALQVRIGLVALVYLGSSTFPLQVAQSLTRLEKATAQRAVWEIREILGKYAEQSGAEHFWLLYRPFSPTHVHVTHSKPSRIRLRPVVGNHLRSRDRAPSMRGEIDPGVGRVKEALRRLGQPEVDLRGRCLHVAGTNGKGSVTWLEPAAGEAAVPNRRVAVRVGLGEGREKPGWVDERNIAALPKSRTSTKVCAMLFAVCRHAGFRVGMFTSPHLLEPLDAIQMAEEGEETPVQPETWKLLEEEVKKLCGHATPEISLTIFELQVVTSLLLFARHQVDVAIIEVGMGGLEDATNVLLEPAACCITSIALDHEKFLGPTHEDIAKHKAGIFQRGRPAYVAKDGMSESVQRVIAEVAERVGALLFWVAPAEVVGEPPHGRGRGHQTLQARCPRRCRHATEERLIWTGCFLMFSPNSFLGPS
ncbi:unnamed protein product [Durusdinium trenchii]|uniref:Mur ligase central domain-containing protein n=1 Tax=Durusdinium trenchii TaxID=1381693 RepID=A0ABP0JJA9_9DINO